MSLFLVLIFIWAIPTNAFNPLSISVFGSSNSATHESITRCAFAIVTNEYIRTQFGIKIQAPTITNGNCPSAFFTQLKAAFPKITSKTTKTYADWKKTIDYIVAQNAAVDVAEQHQASSHFDSESFILGSSVIFNRYQSAVKALNTYAYDKSNDYFGKMTHTLQDFYSHSNWIEMNQRQPHPDLGIKTMTAKQFAGPTVRTCTNCATGPTAVCRSNNDVTKGLTSGYFSMVIDILVRKPTGKCSHGGSADATKNNDAIGGINKDTLSSIHGYLHQPAAQTAYLATCKILRQFRAKVTDIGFGRFLNILPRQTSAGRSMSFSSPSSVYTTILNNLQKADSFTRIQQVISSPAEDAYYKAHILSIAAAKNVAIDLLLQKNVNFDSDLAKSTGGLSLLIDDASQVNINRHQQMELIDILYSKRTSDNIAINIDRTCSSVSLELISNTPISSLIFRLKNGEHIVSPSSVVANTVYYKSYSFANLPSGTWTLIFSSSSKSTFDLHVSCISEFRCFSHLYVNNDNSIHPGVVELEGNPIQDRSAFLITTCDDHTMPMENMFVAMVDDTNGKTFGNVLPSTHDLDNDRWITNLTNIPSKTFRLKYLIGINDQSIQRLSHKSYRPSLIDVEISHIDTEVPNNTQVHYRLISYHKRPVTVKFIAKNIGTYIERRVYRLKAGETRDDQIEFDQKTKAPGMTGNMLALTVARSETDWNYDVFSF